MNVANLKRAAVRLACIAIAGIGLAGCYNLDATLSFRDDGTAAATTRFDFPRDAEHVFKFYQAILELQPGSAKFVENGLCQSVQKRMNGRPKTKSCVSLDTRSRGSGQSQQSSLDAVLQIDSRGDL